MIRYLGKRAGAGAVSLLCLITLTFFLVHFMPGTPFDAGNVSEQILQVLEHKYGLDQPVSVQYFRYMGMIFRGDFGISMKKQGVAVNQLIMRCIPVTARLGISAFFLACVLGAVLGGIGYRRKGSWIAVVCRGIRSTAIAIPNYVYGLGFMLIFGVWLKWFPIAGIATGKNYVLPVLSLALYPAGTIATMVETALSEEEQKEYVVLLRAKGLTSAEILRHHFVKPVFLQVLPYLGQLLAYLLTGCFVIENIFTIPGLGREFVTAITNRDYTVIMGLTIFMGIVVTGVQLVVDILQKMLDPRIRNEGTY